MLRRDHNGNSFGSCNGRACERYKCDILSHSDPPDGSQAVWLAQPRVSLHKVPSGSSIVVDLFFSWFPWDNEVRKSETLSLQANPIHVQYIQLLSAIYPIAPRPTQPTYEACFPPLLWACCFPQKVPTSMPLHLYYACIQRVSPPGNQQHVIQERQSAPIPTPADNEFAIHPSKRSKSSPDPNQEQKSKPHPKSHFPSPTLLPHSTPH